MTANQEIELKFRLKDPDALRARLVKQNATHTASVLECNVILDTPDHDLLRQDCGLRIRAAQPAGGAGAAHATLTYKGPRAVGDLKQRAEFETEIADAATAIAMLQQLGYHPVVLFEKRRETWRLGSCEITLDELPRLGWYLEIEGPDGDSINNARDTLELSDEDVILKTYVHLAAEQGHTDPTGLRRLMFDDPSPQ